MSSLSLEKFKEAEGSVRDNVSWDSRGLEFA